MDIEVIETNPDPSVKCEDCGAPATSILVFTNGDKLRLCEKCVKTTQEYIEIQLRTQI